MRLRPGSSVIRRIRGLGLSDGADEITRLSLVVLHGNTALTYALFTVAFMEQVAVPTMARTLYRRGTGDIMQLPTERNADTLVFFGQLLDHGPDSPIGRAWINRLNDIHAHFPLRNEDSLYTLATLALDPHRITSQLGRSPFTRKELEAQWQFWRTVARLQGIQHIPRSRNELERWRISYETREFEPSFEGREVAHSLIDTFGEQILPRPLRRYAIDLIAALCTPRLREIHDLPEPSRLLGYALRAATVTYALSKGLRPVDVDRSFVEAFGSHSRDPHDPSTVGYRNRRPLSSDDRPLDEA
ncbi:oxygenase MpaB family protein [Nocardia salmonicida]|uniref:oxygenase MpaB family protein n=1 Tax=Nocardia salmonicida TaxID=53431 RepID=UPI002E29AFB4|nr:oxygenase MpaB family protein [Nocardia salmonicida]